MHFTARYNGMNGNDSAQARRTRELISIDYFLTLIISAHGCFGQYLVRFRRDSQFTYTHCLGAREATEHALLECPRCPFLLREKQNPDDGSIIVGPKLRSKRLR
uniref:Uncharacterized protein n=1 Tax=Glossina brevipalpis TaxID=37001 RepID=A0A1A9W7C7_9MUSC